MSKIQNIKLDLGLRQIFYLTGYGSKIKKNYHLVLIIIIIRLKHAVNYYVI